MNPTHCKLCGEVVIWMRTIKNNKWILVNWESVTTYESNARNEPLFDHRSHTAHFRTCTAARHKK